MLLESKRIGTNPYAVANESLGANGEVSENTRVGNKRPVAGGMDLNADNAKSVLKNFLTRFLKRDPSRDDCRYVTSRTPESEGGLYSSQLYVPCFNSTAYCSGLWGKWKEAEQEAEQEAAQQFLDEPAVQDAARHLPPSRKSLKRRRRL